MTVAGVRDAVALIARFDDTSGPFTDLVAEIVETRERAAITLCHLTMIAEAAVATIAELSETTIDDVLARLLDQERAR